MTKAITVLEQRTVDFYGDAMVAVRSANGDIYVPVRPICEQIGVDWPAQFRRIKRDVILSEEQMVVAVTATTDGANETQTHEMVALPLKYLNGWLFGLNPSRVKEEVRDVLIRYQRECYDVLYEAFYANRVTARPDPDFDELLNTDSPTAQAYKMIMAMAQMARQQLIIESRVDSNSSEIKGLDGRVQILEARAGDKSRQVDNAQASKISQAVKAIALELGKRTGGNEFGGVYGELYRRFEIAGYRELPAAQFEEAMLFLRDWYGSLMGQDNVPF